MSIRIIIEPKCECEKSVIFLHGMNQDESDIIEIIDKINESYNFIRFIVPVSNLMDINWPSGIEKNVLSWYNYYTQYDNEFKHDIINKNELQESTDKLCEIINNEINNVGNENVYLIGISQGGTVCINASLIINKPIKILCIDTIFLHTYANFTNNTFHEYNVFQSKNDEIYNPLFQDYCYNLLSQKGHKIVKHIYDQGHCENMDNIYNFIIKNLQKNK
jgi:predicted esterase